MTLPVGAFHSDDATHLAAGRHPGAGSGLSCVAGVEPIENEEVEEASLG
jgi:hypothetical protein